MTRAPALQQRLWTRWRVTALALCAVFGLAQALPVLHFALVAHQLCAEHGQLEHVEAGQAAAVHGNEGQPGSSEVQLVGSASESHAHDHCGVIASGHGHGLRLASAQGCLRTPWYSAAEPSAAQHAHASIALLSYAPKLAPPRV